MNSKSDTLRFFKPSQPKTITISALKTVEKQKNTKFSFGLYGLVTSLALCSVAAVNWLVDPLWYNRGNVLTGKNFAFNERITKTNVFLRTKEQVDYDCIILGSSRVTTLRQSEFVDNKCFNFSLKGGKISDFINYATFLKEEGIDPDIVYLGVDGLNFVEEKQKEQPLVTIPRTESALEAYLSTDVLLFSAMTLLGVSPDPGNYYDRNFEPVDFADPPVYQPEFYQAGSQQRCDLSSVESFIGLKELFPNAKFVAYVPPRSAWSVIDDTYGRGLMDCYLSAFYELAQSYDTMYDFSIPSQITKNPDNTFDGSHYSVEVNNQIAEILQQDSSDNSDDNFGIRIDRYSFAEYRNIYRQELHQFLAEKDQLERWNDSEEISIDMVL